MELTKIARILFNMSLNMDYADFLEDAEQEIAQITNELQLLKDNGCDSTLQALENIAMDNEKMEFWKEMQIAKRLWNDLGKVPVDDKDCIDEDWHIFKKGTSKFDIWSWFEEEFHLSVAIDLMHLEEGTF